MILCFSLFHGWLLLPPMQMQVLFPPWDRKKGIRKLTVGKGGHLCGEVKEKSLVKVHLFLQLLTVKMKMSVVLLTWRHASECNESCTEGERWSVSLLCTPGQALGTAAVLSFTECVGVAFGYQLLLQKRKKGLGKGHSPTDPPPGAASKAGGVEKARDGMASSRPLVNLICHLSPCGLALFSGRGAPQSLPHWAIVTSHPCQLYRNEAPLEWTVFISHI